MERHLELNRWLLPTRFLIPAELLPYTMQTSKNEVPAAERMAQRQERIRVKREGHRRKLRKRNMRLAAFGILVILAMILVALVMIHREMGIEKSFGVWLIDHCRSIFQWIQSLVD